MNIRSQIIKSSHRRQPQNRQNVRNNGLRDWMEHDEEQWPERQEINEVGLTTAPRHGLDSFQQGCNEQGSPGLQFEETMSDIVSKMEHQGRVLGYSDMYLSGHKWGNYPKSRRDWPSKKEGHSAQDSLRVGDDACSSKWGEKTSWFVGHWEERTEGSDLGAQE